MAEMGRRGVYWINLAYDRDRWRDRVVTTKILWVPEMAVNFLTG